MKNIVVFLLLLSLTACANPRAASIDKSFNVEEFPGLVALGESYPETKLNYDLEGSNGSLIHFSSCLNVDETPEDAIVPSQYPLYRLLQLNCQAVERYHQASAARRTYFPKELSENFLQKLPATAVPDLGGQSLDGKSDTMGDTHPGMAVTEIDAGSARIVLGDMDTDYIVLARGDFDHDGIEDMLLRLDWSITSAFGNGFDLLMLSADDSGYHIKERY